MTRCPYDAVSSDAIVSMTPPAYLMGLLRPPLAGRTSYRELMLGSELTLRSRAVESIYQEIWGALIACTLIRCEMVNAAFEARCESTELSFARSFHLVPHETMWTARTPALAKLPAPAIKPPETKLALARFTQRSS